MDIPEEERTVGAVCVCVCVCVCVDTAVEHSFIFFVLHFKLDILLELLLVK